MGLNAGEVIVIIAVILLLFGAQKLPELARSLGKALKEFKKGMKEGADEDGEKNVQSPGSGVSRKNKAAKKKK